MRRRTLFGIIWHTVSQFGRQLLSIVFSIFLLRLLHPEDFGLLAIILLFVSLLKMIVEFGFSAIIVQRKAIPSNDLSSIFWFLLLNGLLFSILLFGGASWIAKYFEEPQLVSIGQLLSILIFLSSWVIIPRALLEKQLRYRVIAKVELSAIIISGGIAIWMAYNHYGVLSLVVQQLSMGLLTALIFTFTSKWRPKFVLDIKRIPIYFHLGASLFSNYFLAFIADNLDDFLIGKQLGKVPLGLYNRAFMISSIPVKNIAQNISQVLVASFSKIQEDKTKLRSTYLMINRLVVLLSFPIMLLLFIHSDFLIATFLGKKWLPMTDIFQVFCLIGLAASINALLGTLIISQGQSQLIFRDGLIQKSIIVLSIIVGIQWGIMGVVWARLLAETINILVTFFHAKKSIGLSILKQVQNLLPLLLINLLLFLCIHQSSIHFSSGWSFFIISLMAYLVFYWLMLFGFKLKVYEDVFDILKNRSFSK